MAKSQPLIRKTTPAPPACLMLATAMTCAAQPQGPEPLAGTVPGTRFVVTVTEGPGEPRSIGSYALRLYAPHDPAWPYDAFAHGVVCARDGTVESVRFEDVDADGAADVIVVIRAAGSGADLSADAYRAIGKHLSPIARVDQLANDADPVASLRDAATRQTPSPFTCSTK